MSMQEKPGYFPTSAGVGNNNNENASEESEEEEEEEMEGAKKSKIPSKFKSQFKKV